MAGLLVLILVGVWSYLVIPLLIERAAPEYFYLVPILVGIVFLLIALILGKRVPEFLKCTIIFYFFIWAFYATLLGRTVAAGTSLETVKASFFAYFYLALFLQAGLIRIIDHTKRNLILFVVYPFFVVGLACVFASLEEIVFIKLNPQGAEATTRWTVSPSQLKYDGATGKLIGWSD